jgi:hypothetical protein
MLATMAKPRILRRIWNSRAELQFTSIPVVAQHSPSSTSTCLARGAVHALVFPAGQAPLFGGAAYAMGRT